MMLSVDRLTDSVGAEVLGVDADTLLNDADIPAAVLTALDTYGVLVFRELQLDAESQVAFCRRLGKVVAFRGSHPVEGIFRVTLDRTKNPSADYLRGTFDWHIDGCTPIADEFPEMATLISAKVVAERGGETEFASTYVAYEDLDDDEKTKLAEVRVVHSLEASQRTVTPDPTPEQLASWRVRPTREHPLVWTHESGRRSLVIGATTDHVTGLNREEGRKLLDGLLERSTRPERVYRHEWSVGDTVIWDNRGVVHRVQPYDVESPREMLRTTLLGDEPIQ